MATSNTTTTITKSDFRISGATREQSDAFNQMTKLNAGAGTGTIRVGSTADAPANPTPASTLPLTGSLTVGTFDANTIPVGAFVVPAIKAPCSLDREDQTGKNKARKGSSLAKRIKKITEDIENETDCLALQQKIRKELSFLEDFLDEQTKEIQRKLDEILPVLSIPLNPFKIPKYLKKLIIGRILPDLDATIDFIKRVIEVVKAIIDLIEVIKDLKPKLEACAIGTINTIIAEVENEIDKAVADLEKKITEAIGEAICNGLKEAGVTGDNIADILSGVNAVNGLIGQVETLSGQVGGMLNNNLAQLGNSQSIIQQLTGLPPVIDTTSVEAFQETASSEAYAQYRTNVIQVLNQPDPVNSVIPTIAGTVQVGSTLTCSNGTWTSNGVVTTYPLLFQWFRENQEIASANTFQYIPTIDDVEYPLSCRVTADAPVAIEQVFTAQTAPVQFAMASGNIPIISGSALNGQILQCSEGTWPYNPTTIMYEWIRVPTFGANVRIQTLSANNLYTIKSGDVGSKIACKVVASAFRYTLSATTANTATIV